MPIKLSVFRFFIFLMFLSLLTSCVRHKPQERLLPPEPVVIKGDHVIGTDQSSVSEKELGGGTAEQETEEPTEEFKPEEPEWARAEGEGVYKVGSPYKVNGIWYFPSENPRYDEIGFASVYAQSFHGHETANGEIYNKNIPTAAHKTLPLPSIVRVTNLSNNKSVVVRVNDRGPFVNDRLIDLSEKAAQLLGCPQGITKVRVEILPEESKSITEGLKKTPEAFLPQAAYPPIVERSTPARLVEEPVAQSKPLFDEAPFSLRPENQPSLSRNAQKKYYIQAGIFSNPSNVNKLTEELKSIGAVDSFSVHIGGRQLHRVRVGPFSSKQRAESLIDQVKKMNVPDARVILE